MCCIGVFQGLKVLVGGNFQAKRSPLKCDKWSCDDCRPFKSKKLYSRLMNGGLLEMAKIDGFRNQYVVKLLTLTCPGKVYRDSKTPREAYADMTKCFDKLMRALKKNFGAFHYFRVREFQEDGYPHLHVILTGMNIASKGVLNAIRHLWQKKYKMGNVDIQVRKKGQTVENAIRYVLKYIQKAPVSKTDFEKVRLFTASRGALQKLFKRKTDWLLSKVQFKAHSQEDEMPHVFDFEPGTSIDEIPFIHQRFIALADNVLHINILG